VNLKIKQALPETASYLSPSDLARLSGALLCEQPNNRLYNYDGTLNLEMADGNSKSFPLDPSKLLLRGAQLRNTSWIYGFVVFTGHETKLMLNSRLVRASFIAYISIYTS
jgi:phospholipid-transporting ATPase